VSSSRPGPSSAAAGPLWLWGPVALYALAIFVESSISRVPALPSGFTDKDAHALLYAGLAVLILRALSGGRWLAAATASGAAAVGLAALYGISDEFHQRFVPGRTADVFDWFADVVGASLGVVAVLVIARIARRTD
jgi:VanZ family protein